MSRLERTRQADGLVNEHQRCFHDRVIEVIGDVGGAAAYTTGNVIRQGGKLVRGLFYGLFGK